MATDTAPAPAPATAETPPPPAAGKFPSVDDIRATFDTWVQSPPTPDVPATAAATPEAAPLDKREEKPQTTDKQAPAPQAAATPDATPSTEATAQASSAPQEPPPPGETPDAPSAPPGREAPKRGIPPEFQTPEHEAVYKADPLAKREVARIYGDPNLSDVQKALKANERIAAAKGRIEERQAKQRERLELRQRGDFETLGREVAAELDEQTITTEAEATLSRLLATVARTTPDDPDFLTVGADATNNEELYEAFGRWLVLDSPLGKDLLAQREATLAQQFEAKETQLRQQFEQEKQALAAKYKDDLETAVEQVRAELRGGSSAPPRQSATLPPGVEATKPVAPRAEDWRANFAAGLQRG
ncbi:MAG TPA: hypothetical protein VD948_08655 [Rhodothermales bacterium]|nr:hypothetical protein [Rhodothermales bacterium]